MNKSLSVGEKKLLLITLRYKIRHIRKSTPTIGAFMPHKSEAILIYFLISARVDELAQL